MNLRQFATAFLGLVVTAAAASPVVPTVSNVSIEERSPKRVEITYDLAGEDAVITFDVQTNGVSLGKALLKNATGDVFTLVSAGMGRKIVWNARAAVGDRDVVFPNAKAVVTAWKKGAPPDYYVLDLEDGTKSFYESEDLLPLGISSDVYRTSKMVFRRIHAEGEKFIMGSPEAERTAAGINKSATSFMGYETQHEVAFTKDFFIGVFEVTQAQWVKVFGGIPPEGVVTAQKSQNEWKMPQTFFNNGSCAASTLPIQQVAVGRWLRGRSEASGAASAHPHKEHVVYDGSDPNEQASFLHMFRLKAGSATTQYDLPFEAEWEFAARAGTTTAFSDGRDYNSATDYSDIAVYGRAQTDGPLRVGSKKPNAWGLYDMHGNLREYCLDWGKSMANEVDEGSSYVAKDAVDPDGLASGYVPGRGGAYSSAANMIRSSARQLNFDWTSQSDYCGFRIACPIDRW